MRRNQFIVFTLLFCLLAISTQAQQTSKSKSSNKLYEKGGNVFIKNTDKVNTEQLEFSPAFYQNGLVYASSRFKNGAVDKKIGETFFELFYAELDGNGMPLPPRQFSIEVNSHLHEGPVSFNRSGNVIYFTRNNIKKGLQKADSKGVTRLKIYEATKSYFDWEEVKELPFNSDEYSCAHPTLSSDESKLYFSSDMPGGHGGMDLYVVERTGETWSAPRNLGQGINTDGNEVFPFIHSTGTLFFSSTGHNGMGGLDLFMAEETNGSWGGVMNLNKPLNSDKDDLGLILNPEGTRGYFASDRAGGKGKDDIYVFEVTEGFAGTTTPKNFSSQIIVFDSETNERINAADIRIFESKDGGFVSGSNDLYEAVLVPVDGSDELVFKLVRKDLGSLGQPERRSDTKGEATYDFTGEKKYLILVTKDGYTANEVVYSTIGNVAEASVEVPLSKRRCADVSGIVRNKKNNNRIANAVVKIKNSCDGKEEVVLADDKGEFAYCLPLGCNYTLTGIKENFKSAMSTVSAKNPTGPLSADLALEPSTSTTTTVVSSNPVTTGSVIVLEKIYYDFNKSAIRVGAASELEELANIMQRYPSMVIELVAHTDARGSSSYNQTLSQRRAESAKQYLASRGISSSRVKAIGMGEAQLRNRCSDGIDCNEIDHQFNRRTEVRVLKIDNAVRIQYDDNRPEVIDRKN